MSEKDLSCDSILFLGEIVDVYNKMSPDNFVYDQVYGNLE